MKILLMRVQVGSYPARRGPTIFLGRLTGLCLQAGSGYWAKISIHIFWSKQHDILHECPVWTEWCTFRMIMAAELEWCKIDDMIPCFFLPNPDPVVQPSLRAIWYPIFSYTSGGWYNSGSTSQIKAKHPRTAFRIDYLIMSYSTVWVAILAPVVQTWDRAIHRMNHFII